MAQFGEMSNSLGSITAGTFTFSGVSIPRALREPRIVIVCVDVLCDSALLDLFADIDPRLQISRAIDNRGVPCRGQLLDVFAIAKPSDV